MPSVPPQAPGYGAPGAPGAPAGPVYGQPYAPVGSRSPVLSIIALIAGILGVVGFFFDFIPFVGSIIGLVISAGAVVLGFLGKSKEPRAKGLWLTGIILGFVGAAIDIAFLVFWIVLIAVSHDYSYSGY
jgi:hypothetical protein